MFDWLPALSAPATLSGPTLTAYVLFDLFLIVILARLLGTLAVRLGQPRVVGEILAGVLLGPTLLGSLSFVLLPLPARPTLSAIATLGLILFMFLAGLEFDPTSVRGRARQAAILALLSVAVPALIGFPVAAAMQGSAFVGPAGTSLLPFALLLGSALSVTAFPVMAHILLERGELNTPMGALAVAGTGIMSVLMFVYIAFARSIATAAGVQGILMTIGWVIVLGGAAWYVVRPRLAHVLQKSVETGTLSGDELAVIFGGLLLFAFLFDRIGIHALLGGFAWGMIMPAELAFRQRLAAKVRDITMVFLMPVFAAFSGIAADFRLLTSETIPALMLVLAGAIAGKFLAALPSRLWGFSWREVATLGALFNTRGLLVLVVGLIGLDLEIITVATFTIIVLVALVTNMMTLPLLKLFARQRVRPVASTA